MEDQTLSLDRTGPRRAESGLPLCLAHELRTLVAGVTGPSTEGLVVALSCTGGDVVVRGGPDPRSGSFRMHQIGFGRFLPSLDISGIDQAPRALSPIVGMAESDPMLGLCAWA